MTDTTAPRTAAGLALEAEMRFRSDLIDAIAFGLHKTRASNDAPEFDMEKADERAEAIWDYVKPLFDARDARAEAIEPLLALVRAAQAISAGMKYEIEWPQEVADLHAALAALPESIRAAAK